MTTPSAGIAYVLAHHPRTAQTFIQAELEALRHDGHDVTVFSLNRPPSDQLRTSRDRAEMESTIYLKDLGRVSSAVVAAFVASPSGFVKVLARAVRSAGTDLRRVVWRLFHLAEASVVWRECRARNVEVIHAHFGQSTSTVGWLASWLARELGSGPSDLVVTVHCGTEVEDTADTIPALKARDARAIIAVSDHTRSQLMRHVPAHEWQKIHVLRCGIDLDFFGPLPRREPGDPPTVLFVGRLDPVKGVPVLLEAVRSLRARGTDVHLEIVGAGSLERELRSAASGEDWVQFLGELPPDQVRERLQEADVFCLPSLDEGIPVSIMEAMAVGIPVVTTAIAGIPELARHEETALVVAAGNASELADAIERMISDPVLATDLRTAARALVSELHDKTTTLPRLIDLLTRRC
jgi:colanic acid/amylovoran biosynthesis glycosyltransferase